MHFIFLSHRGAANAFQNLGNGFNNEKKFSKIFCEIGLFFIFKPNVVYLRSFLAFLQFSKFWKHIFMYFEHKYVKT